MESVEGSGLVSFRTEKLVCMNRARSKLGGKMTSLTHGLGPAKSVDLSFESLSKLNLSITADLEEDLDSEVFVHTPTYSEAESAEVSEAEEGAETGSTAEITASKDDVRGELKGLTRVLPDGDDLSDNEFADASSETSTKSLEQGPGFPSDEVYSPVPSDSPRSVQVVDDEAVTATSAQNEEAQNDVTTSFTAPASSLEDKAVGCMLGLMCGDVLGTAYEGWSMSDVQKAHPNGVTDFKYTRLTGYGVYTGDMGLSIGVMLGLLRIGCCNAKQCADEFCQLYKPQRGYTDDTGDIINLLCEGVDYRETATRFENEGSYGNGGAVRVAPIGLAYRNATPEVIHCAVRAALLCTHVHPLGIDGAFIQACAVAWLCKQADGSSSCSPPMLLAHLLLLSRTDDMFHRLSVIADHLRDLMHLHKGGVSDWNAYLQSPAWHALEMVAGLISPAIQGTATEAVAVALLVTACHWHDPEAAIVTAVHLGGCTSCVASLVGGHAGALHGWRWVPLRWFKSLENGPHGRDVIINLARQLKLKDIRECSSPPLPTMRPGKKTWFRTKSNTTPPAGH